MCCRAVPFWKVPLQACASCRQCLCRQGQSLCLMQTVPLQAGAVKPWKTAAVPCAGNKVGTLNGMQPCTLFQTRMPQHAGSCNLHKTIAYATCRSHCWPSLQHSLPLRLGFLKAEFALPELLANALHHGLVLCMVLLHDGEDVLPLTIHPGLAVGAHTP